MFLDNVNQLVYVDPTPERRRDAMDLTTGWDFTKNEDRRTREGGDHQQDAFDGIFVHLSVPPPVAGTPKSRNQFWEILAPNRG